MSGRVTGSLDVGERPWGIALSPDGTTLYSANGPSNDISVVDLSTLRVTNKIKVGRGPWGIVALSH
jgi:YVTN family beta-propeller protein